MEEKTFCYELHLLWYSYPCQPVNLSTGGTINEALGMHNNRKGEGVTTGEIQAKSLQAAKAKVTRLTGFSGGKWEESYHPFKDGYFPCWKKDNQNKLYLWEK